MKQNTPSARIAASLRAEIRSGARRPGERVPSAREIVREHGVALATASRVLAILRRERLVRVVRGVGTVVREGPGGLDLSRDRIVEAAVAIADDEGLAALSMRAVAIELGVATMSLYRHVASKDELLVAMIDAAMAEEPLPRHAGSVRAQLAALARLQWRVYQRHPWLAPALSMTRPQATPNGMAHTEWVLRALANLGLPPAVALRKAVVFISFVRGFAVSLEPEREAERDTGLRSDEWIDAQGASFATLLARFPLLHAASQAPAPALTLDDLFEEGLAQMLAGLPPPTA